jgi:phosphoribosylformimino-5-aminoimidazole carboxamide ribotide isomerase
VRCIFVLDILNGAVVRALRGERSCYEPVSGFSRIVSTSGPLGILKEVRPAEVYVADLNLLTGQGDNLAVIREISNRAATMADTAISKSCDLARLPASVLPVLGTETASLNLIKEAARDRKIIVSLDMMKRKVLSRDPELAGQTPQRVLRELCSLELQGVILLELDRVGTSAGLDMRFLEDARQACRQPLILGGGVKDEEDLEILEMIGFSGALVATAVHNGSIPVSRLRQLSPSFLPR